jgi:hypothetical protein
MSSYDPRQILLILEDLLETLQIWSTYAKDTLQEVDYTQRLSAEHVERTRNNVAITRSQLERDEQLFETRKARYDAVASQCAEAVTASQETLSQAQQAAQEARQAHGKWQRELRKAQGWLERALKRLEVAQREYERAKSALRQAERQYDNAKRRLRRCRNDDDRYSCASEQRALERAGLNLQHARGQLMAAQRELEAAKREVQRAQARVECCKQAVALTKQAVAKAIVALEVAEQAERAASISTEFSDIVQRLASQAKTAFSEEATAIASAVGTIGEATTFTEEAQRHLSTASSLEDSAQVYVNDIGLELGRRTDSLIALNRPLPGLEISAPAVSSGGARQPILTATLEAESHYPGVNVLDDIPELDPERWRELISMEERLKVLQEAENRLAEAQGRPPLPVRVEKTLPRLLGYCDGTKIVISTALIGNDDAAEVVSTLTHEGRHAYQINAVKHLGFHPNTQEVQKWQDNFNNYKTVQKDGLPAYFNQPVEADARAYAEHVILARYGGK